MKKIISFFIMIILILFLNGCQKNEEEVFFEEEIKVEEKEKNIEEQKNYINVDIKGQIKNPGVYQIIEETNINELIKLAGGLNKNGTTENINLAKKLEDEMIIIIKSKAELKKQLNADNVDSIGTVCPIATYDCSECLRDNNSIIINDSNRKKDIDVNENNNKISINKGTLEELITLPGIGESKANAIIDYRNINGYFITIEDLKNVSGIGDIAFEKIKDFITV